MDSYASPLHLICSPALLPAHPLACPVPPLPATPAWSCTCALQPDGGRPYAELVTYLAMDGSPVPGWLQVIMEWKPKEVFWNTSLDDVVVLPESGEAPSFSVFVSQAVAGISQPVLEAFSAASDASRMEALSDEDLVRPLICGQWLCVSVNRADWTPWLRFWWTCRSRCRSRSRSRPTEFFSN